MCDNKTLKIVIDHEKCTGSGECIKACPEKAIYVSEGKVFVDQEKCDLDGICMPACPNGAASIEE